MDYDNKGYVQLNGKTLSRLRNSAVVHTEPYRKAFGGFGGGFSVFKIEISVPKDFLVSGENKVRFVFDQFDGFSLGYRILSFNILHDGVALIPSNRFQQRSLDDVDGRGTIVTASADSPSDITEGKRLWSEANIVRSYQEPISMKGKCADCHFSTGYDLKYFGFSRNSISKRAVFHGLTESQGRQIAAFIRSIPVESFGRPWNPPYQPGPGLAQKPTLAWLAGAGIDAVIDDESQTIADAFPNGIPSAIPFKQKGRLDLTNVRVALELPVWKHWLPRILPFEDEVFGDEFKTIGPYRFVRDFVHSVPKNLKYGDPDSYRDFSGPFGTLMGSNWYDDILSPTGLFNRRWTLGSPADSGYAGNLRHQIKAYSLLQWRLVKNLQGHHQLGFDQIGHLIANAHLDSSARTPRALMTKDLFDTAPHMVKLVNDSAFNNGVRNGTLQNWSYFSSAWYYAQLLVNDNFRDGDGATHWPYTTAFASIREGDLDFPGLRMLTLLKAVEAYTFFPLGSNRLGAFRFFPYLNRFHEGLRGPFRSLPAATKTRMIEAIIRGYLEVQDQYSRTEYMAALPEQFTGPCANELGVHSDALEGCQASVYYTMYRELLASGVSANVLNSMTSRAEVLWPQFVWSCIKDTSKSVSQCQAENRASGITVSN